MAHQSEDARARAEAKFDKKELQRQEAEQVWAERAAAAKASDLNAARLKALRLAKEAADTAGPLKPSQRGRAALQLNAKD